MFIISIVIKILQKDYFLCKKLNTKLIVLFVDDKKLLRN